MLKPMLVLLLILSSIIIAILFTVLLIAYTSIQYICYLCWLIDAIFVTETAVCTYYSYTLLKNFMENPKLSLTMLYTHPKTLKAFKILAISLIVFASFQVIHLMALILHSWIPWVFSVLKSVLVGLPPSIYLLGFIYFVQVLKEVTKGS